jgi:hypothetical protein
LDAYVPRALLNDRASLLAKSPSCQRILLGFFTTPGDKDIQEQWREVLPFHEVGQKLRCGLNAIYVLSTSAPGFETPSVANSIVLPVPENARGAAKTFSFFNESVGLFPDADMMVKISTAAAICTKTFQNLLSHALDEGVQYIGFKMDKAMCSALHPGALPGERTTSPVLANNLECPPAIEEKVAGELHWHYMSSTMYGLSRELVVQVVHHNFTLRHQTGPEEYAMGQWVHIANRNVTSFSIECLHARSLGMNALTSWGDEDCPVKHDPTMVNLCPDFE